MTENYQRYSTRRLPTQVGSVEGALSSRVNRGFFQPGNKWVRNLTILLFWGGTLFFAGCTPPAVDPDVVLEPTLVEGISLKPLGTGDKRLRTTNAILLDPEKGLDATILQATHNHETGRTVLYTPNTDQTSYLEMPGTSGAWGVTKTSHGVYLAAHMNGAGFFLAPGASSFEKIVVPGSNEKDYQFVFSVAEASDGNMYFGTYPEGELLRFTPETKSLGFLGTPPGLPDGANYLRNLNGQFPGKLYGGMGAHARLVEYDLETGQWDSLLPESFSDRTWVAHTTRYDSLLVVLVRPEDTILFIDPETHELVRSVPLPDPIWPHHEETLLVRDDAIYFGTLYGDDLQRYDIKRDTVETIAPSIGRPIGVAADRYLFTNSELDQYSILDLETMEVVLSRKKSFEGAGMQIHAIAEGPDRTIVGGAYINMGYFSFPQDGGTPFSPGTAIPYPGQIDQLVASGNKVYLAHYTDARLSVYDPFAEWRPGKDSGANPRVIVSTEQDQDRFPIAYAAEDGLLYFGSIPKYGKLGGALVVLDPDTDKVDVYRNVVQDQSVYALTGFGDGILYGSTSIRGGLGSVPTASSARLFAWDLSSRKKRFEREISAGADEMWGLDKLPDGRLIGSVDSSMYVFNPQTDSVDVFKNLTPEPITKLVMSADGWCYGLTEHRFFRVSPDLSEYQVINEDETYWDALVETTAGRLFVGRGAILYEVIREE